MGRRVCAPVGQTRRKSSLAPYKGCLLLVFSFDTRLDTPPSINRRHPDSRLALVRTPKGLSDHLAVATDGEHSGRPFRLAIIHNGQSVIRNIYHQVGSSQISREPRGSRAAIRSSAYQRVQIERTLSRFLWPCLRMALSVARLIITLE